MINRLRRANRRGASPRTRSGGQALVEFALVLPLFILLLLTIVEFAFVFNAMLGISFAARDGALVASESGNALDADCAILQKISSALTAPINQSRISSVVIYRTDSTGSLVVYSGQKDTYVPGGTTTCNHQDGTPYSVAFTLSGSKGYDPVSRCNVLAGCGLTNGTNGANTGAMRSLDTIGVQITYVHTWVTPLRGIGGPQGANVTVTQSNAMRMEPVL